ncbi:MAG: hypothetical protein U0610_13425 [bacterium]
MSRIACARACHADASPFLVTCLMLALATPARAEWGTAAPLSGATGGSSAYGGPSVGVSADRSAVMAWRSSAYDVRAAVRDRASGTWSFTLLSTDTCTTVPAVAMNDAGDAVVAWVGFGYVFARYRPAGGNWGASATLATNTSGSYVAGGAHAAINNAGDVVVSWIGVNVGVTQYEVHAVVRSKWGAWPSTNAFEVAGGPTDAFGESAIAIDDAGHVASGWVEEYATFDDSPASHHVNVVRAAVRAPGGGWGAAIDLSSRGSQSGSIHCAAGHPPMPTASAPSFSADPATGQLAVVYFADPTSYEYKAEDAACNPTTADSWLRRAEGTVASPPVGGLDLGTAVGLTTQGGAPQVSLRGGQVTIAWGESDGNGVRTQFAVGPFGGPLGTTPLALGYTIAVAMGGDARGFYAGSKFSSGHFSTVGASRLAGGLGDGPTTLSSAAAAPSVAATCGDYAIAGMIGEDGKIHIAEYPASAPACGVFGDSFESGGLTHWTSHMP